MKTGEHFLIILVPDNSKKEKFQGQERVCSTMSMDAMAHT